MSALRTHHCHLTKCGLKMSQLGAQVGPNIQTSGTAKWCTIFRSFSSTTTLTKQLGYMFECYDPDILCRRIGARGTPRVCVSDRSPRVAAFPSLCHATGNADACIHPHSMDGVLFHACSLDGLWLIHDNYPSSIPLFYIMWDTLRNLT